MQGESPSLEDILNLRNAVAVAEDQSIWKIRLVQIAAPAAAFVSTL